MPVLKFDDPPCVMVRILKTGSTSVIQALFASQTPARSFGSMPDDWREFYSFAFVRNPFDRLVSAFLMFARYPVASPGEREFRGGLTLSRVMDVIEDDSIPLQNDDYLSKLRRHAIPMTAAFNCLAFAKDVYRFESFESECLRLAARVGREVPEWPHCRARSRGHYREYFSPADRDRAGHLFAKDLAEFSYRF